jgi:hypothetical protein
MPNLDQRECLKSLAVTQREAHVPGRPVLPATDIRIISAIMIIPSP